MIKVNGFHLLFVVEAHVTGEKNVHLFTRDIKCESESFDINPLLSI